MEAKLFDSEYKLMNELWAAGDLSAQQLAQRLAERVGWSKTTTYTIIKKCIDKGFIERNDPGFVCRARITREQAQQAEANELIDKWFGGSADQLVASLLSRKRLGSDQIERLRALIDEEE